MTFEEAVTELKTGAKLTRLGWNDRGAWITMHDGYLRIMGGVDRDGKLHDLILRDGDIFADDWQSVDSVN